MKRLSQILVIMLLFVAGSATAQSDVYEYATVMSHYSSGTKFTVYVSFSSGEYKEIEFDKNDAKPALTENQTAVLKYVSQLTKDGWEVVNAQKSSSADAWSYFLKRKQKSNK